MAGSTEPSKRKDPSERTKMQVWGAAAGRCTLCNQSVLGNDLLGEPVPIGELAHNIGATVDSPRGESELDRDDRAMPENLMLACRNCHKPVDDAGQVGRWTIAELTEKKRIHEERVRNLTSIGADRAAYLIRMVGPIRGAMPELSPSTVLAAATAAGIYPQRLPESHFADIDLDLRAMTEPTSLDEFEAQAREVARLAERVHEGVRRESIDRVAVFAIARIALLVQLGASLDDKVDTLVFQRHRVDGTNAWGWPTDEVISEFETSRLQDGTDSSKVVLIMSLSGAIDAGDLPDAVRGEATIYEVRPSNGERGPGTVSSQGELAAIEETLRGFLADVESEHGTIDNIDVFPAIGVATAVTLGRVLMPEVSPALSIYERDDGRAFYKALEVRR